MSAQQQGAAVLRVTGLAEAVPKQSSLCVEDQIQPRLRKGREYLGSAGPRDRPALFTGFLEAEAGGVGGY